MLSLNYTLRHIISPFRKCNQIFFSTKTTSQFENFEILVGKREIKQSPWKMKFLVSLVRNTWVPDALAQLKFSPKHRCEDVARIVKRAVALADKFHGAIPEELYVKEIMVTKGFQQKRMRIMGKGRTGVGYRRQSHVALKVSKVDFEDKIKNGRPNERKMWSRRYQEVLKAKEASKIKSAQS